MTMTTTAMSAAIPMKVKGLATIVFASWGVTVLVGTSSPVRIGVVAWLSVAPSIGSYR